MLAFPLATLYSWIATGLPVIALIGHFSSSPMNLGPAIGLMALPFGGVYRLWGLGIWMMLALSGSAVLHGALSRAFPALLPAFAAYCPIGP